MAKPWLADKWAVSPFNFDRLMNVGTNPPRLLKFHDTTLRDGEQQAGVIFTKYDKVMIGRLLNRVGLDRIEVGTPGTSLEDREAMRLLVAASLETKLFSWCRNNKLDIAAAKECGSSGVTIELPANPHLAKNTYAVSIDEMLRRASENAQYAVSEGLQVIPLLVDATRSDLITIKSIINTMEKYCDGIALSDTFGVILPNAMFSLISRVKGITKIPIEVHCHNDFGLATANTLAAVAAGAAIAHVTVNGLGERAGNTALAEVALGAKLLMGLETRLDLTQLYRLSEAVAQASGFNVPPTKPVVGSNIFNVESAQSAQWLASKKDSNTYPYTRELVGNLGFKLTLSKKSGPANLEMKISELNLNIPKEKYPEILGRIYEKSLQKKGAITDEEFLDILQDLGLIKYKQEELVRG